MRMFPLIKKKHYHTMGCLIKTGGRVSPIIMAPIDEIEEHALDERTSFTITRGDTTFVIGPTNVKYYGTHGAIFDDGYNPVAMYTCQIKRTEIDSESHTYSYEILKPILRISPDSYKSKGDSMEKFITNKLILASISDSITPRYYDNIINALSEYNVEVVIGDIPFKPIIADSPSISTTNKELLELVVDHIEEVIQ